VADAEPEAAPDSGPSCVPPTGDAAVAEYPIASAVDGGPQALRIVRGPDGNMWLAATNDNSLVRVTPEGAMTRFVVPTPQAQPAGLVVGPDGAIWFTESGSAKVGRLGSDGGILELSLPPEPDGGAVAPVDIAAGPDGNLWITLPFDDAIDRLTPSGQDTRFAVGVDAGPLAPNAIVPGPDGNLWFGAVYAPFVNRISTDGGISHVPVSEVNFGMGVGPDGALWFTMRNRIGRIAPGPTPTVEEFAVPGFGPAGIVAGPDCANLYVADVMANQVRSFAPPPADAGPDAQLVFTNYDLPTPMSNVESLAVGPGATVWFVEYDAQKVGFLRP
jgi:virginiamycin B lyase